jgi:predicted nucleic acid-binding protein
MSTAKYLIDTNVLIYHTKGLEAASRFISEAIAQQAFHISILTKIEFLGWERHTREGLQKCEQLVKLANIYLIDENIAEQAIVLRRRAKIKLADAVIAATALVNNLRLATRNVEDYRAVKDLEILNPFK